MDEPAAQRASISTSRLDRLILTAFNGEPPADYRPLHRQRPAQLSPRQPDVAAPDAESWLPNAAAADIGAVTLDDLDLSVRTYNVLTREGHQNLLDLCERARRPTDDAGLRRSASTR